MLVTINEDGVLIIGAENSLESFALKQWSKENELPKNMYVFAGTLTESLKLEFQQNNKI